jgi:hypothetical protein
MFPQQANLTKTKGSEISQSCTSNQIKLISTNLSYKFGNFAQHLCDTNEESELAVVGPVHKLALCIIILLCYQDHEDQDLQIAHFSNTNKGTRFSWQPCDTLHFQDWHISQTFIFDLSIKIL